MIRIGFDTTVAIGLFLVTLSFTGFWFMEYLKNSGRSRQDQGDLPQVRQCPYCSHLCEQDEPGDAGKIVVCPFCKSYFGEE